jgi:hypothetical protein
MKSRQSIITNSSGYISMLGKINPGAPIRSRTCASNNSKWNGTAPRGNLSRDISYHDCDYDNESDVLSGSVSHEQRDWTLNYSLPRYQTGLGLMLEPVIEGEEKYEGYPLNDLADEEESFSPGRPMKQSKIQKTETLKDGSEKDGYEDLILKITSPEPSEQSDGDLPAFQK